MTQQELAASMPEVKVVINGEEHTLKARVLSRSVGYSLQFKTEIGDERIQVGLNMTVIGSKNLSKT